MAPTCRSGVADRCRTGRAPPTLGRPPTRSRDVRAAAIARRLGRRRGPAAPSDAAARARRPAALRADRGAPPARADPARRGPRRRRPRRQPRDRVPGRRRDPRRACRRRRRRASCCGPSGTGSSRPSVAPRVRSTAPPASRPGSAPATPTTLDAADDRGDARRRGGRAGPARPVPASATRRSSTRSRRRPRRSARRSSRAPAAERVRRGRPARPRAGCARRATSSRGAAWRCGSASDPSGIAIPGAVSCLLLLCAPGGPMTDRAALLARIEALERESRRAFEDAQREADALFAQYQLSQLVASGWVAGRAGPVGGARGRPAGGGGRRRALARACRTSRGLALASRSVGSEPPSARCPSALDGLDDGRALGRRTAWRPGRRGLGRPPVILLGLWSDDGRAPDPDGIRVIQLARHELAVAFRGARLREASSGSARS